MAGTPATVRAAGAANAVPGFLVQPGVDLLVKELGGKPAVFARWRADPVTKLVVRALQGLALRPPANLTVQDSLVQYGVTQGLSLALQLCLDPSLLWPRMFSADGMSPPPVPEMDFGTTIDEMIDPATRKEQ